MATDAGLEGVVVAETTLSEIDGELGRLLIRGFPIEDLAGRAGFEDMCGLLWDGGLPDSARREALQAALAGARSDAFDALGRMGDALEAPTSIEALRAGLAHRFAEEASAIGVTGAAAVIAAAWARRRAGQRPVPPDPTRCHAQDYLRMVVGEEVEPARAAALETYLVTVAEHGMNASTFAARVVASTGSDAVSAVVAAIGALKGPLHGGAPGPVIEMLDAIGTADRAAPWLMEELAAGRRIMGMGHRIYRTRDPRVLVLEGVIDRFQGRGEGSERLELAHAVEREARRLLRERHPDRAIEANVEFATAVLLEAIGIPRDLFTATFAVARVAGWVAHVQEQWTTRRLIRPTARYVGPKPQRLAG